MNVTLNHILVMKMVALVSIQTDPSIARVMRNGLAMVHSAKVTHDHLLAL